MTDRELLELAAKAAGIDLQWQDGWNGMEDLASAHGRVWHPLADDGDALRLAVDANVQFGLTLEDARGYAESGDCYREFEWDMHRPTDRYAALRLAIVKVAAENGKAIGMTAFRQHAA